MGKHFREMGRCILPLLTICAGLCLMAYPWIGNWLHERSVDSTVDAYEEKACGLDRADTERMWENASQYNERLASAKVVLTDPFTFTDENGRDIAYESVLSIDSTGVMCSVEIPKIDVCLPVYHGTSETVLKKGAGHLECSSFPIGGESAHAVISAHTGLSTAKMFTDLTELKEGDIFFLHVLDRTLAYSVCSIQVVRPEETEPLSIQKGRDIVTLLTCTPYGVNTHRLLVTGERTEYSEEVQKEAESAAESDAGNQSQWMRSYKRAVLAGLLLVLVLYACMKMWALSVRIRKIRRKRKMRRIRKRMRKRTITIKRTGQDGKV